MTVAQLGDIIDDHCTRCHLLTNHSVVAMIGDEVKKVRCRTCNYEHDFRHGKGGQKKKPKLSPYEQVLASVTAGKLVDSSREPAGPGLPSKTPARRRTRPLSQRARPLPQR